MHIANSDNPVMFYSERRLLQKMQQFKKKANEK